MIEAMHLTKRFGGLTAVSDLNFAAKPGHVYGLLGANGAGKSTTMNMLAGCLSASEGVVRIGGYDLFEQPRAAKQLIGYLPEQPPLYLDMTSEEYLKFVLMAKGVRGHHARLALERLMERTGVDGVKHRLIGKLSKGYRQRVGIAQALAGDPQVVILDEPTAGLDPEQILEFRCLLRELGRERTVILSSHILPEVNAVCGEVMILAQGRVVARGTPEQLAQLTQGGALCITVKGAVGDARRALDGLAGLQSAVYEEAEDGVRARLVARAGEDLREAAFGALSRAALPILAMQVEGANLEAVFLGLTRPKEGERT